jgi:hypothetical protein
MRTEEPLVPVDLEGPTGADEFTLDEAAESLYWSLLKCGENPVSLFFILWRLEQLGFPSENMKIAVSLANAKWGKDAAV